MELNGTNKVFVEMKNVPEGKIGKKYKKIPLLIIWEVAHPEGKNKYWYRYDVDKKYFHFDYCHVFSCSLYLRYLLSKNVKKIGVEMTNVGRRLLDMNHLFPV